MNLLQAVHDRWAADAALNGLLPAERVFTGMSADATRPFAVVNKRSHQPLTCHSDGSAITVATLRIEVFHDSHDAAAAIVDQIRAGFVHASFALAGDDRVLGVRHADDFEQQEEDGLWRMVIDLRFTVFLA